MYSHNGTWDFLKLVAVLGFIGLAVWWLDGAIGKDYTVLVIFALVGVIVFAGGAMFAHMNQKQTLDAITKFNSNDAKIDQYRMQSFKAMQQGESAMNRAAAQLTVLDARRVNSLATQQAKMLTDAERTKWEAQSQATDATGELWDINSEDDDSEVQSFREWR